MRREKEEFPSPLGELHFQIKLRNEIVGAENGFRPLSGNYISKYGKEEVSKGNQGRFPSPLGELHFQMIVRVTIGVLAISGFRPLSGNYISKLTVPRTYKDDETLFPSPLGELHFQIQ